MSRRSIDRRPPIRQLADSILGGVALRQLAGFPRLLSLILLGATSGCTVGFGVAPYAISETVDVGSQSGTAMVVGGGGTLHLGLAHVPVALGFGGANEQWAKSGDVPALDNDWTDYKSSVALRVWYPGTDFQPYLRAGWTNASFRGFRERPASVAERDYRPRVHDVRQGRELALGLMRFELLDLPREEGEAKPSCTARHGPELELFAGSEQAFDSAFSGRYFGVRLGYLVLGSANPLGRCP